MRIVIDLAYLLTALVISPVAIYRVIRHKRYRSGWAQRFGKITRRSPHRKCIWLHAVSVGEVNAARTIVKELQSRFPNFEIIISTTTDTGFARARALFGKDMTVFYFPLDFSWIMRRAFHRIQPTLCLLMELEVWPNFVRFAQQLNVPVVVVNGRISDKSFFRYRMVKPLVRRVFRRVSLVLAQTEEYAQRFKELGCTQDKVIVTGSLKYDTAQITNKVDGTDTLAKQLNVSDEQLWVAGATGPGEEAIILDVYKHLTRAGEFEDLRLVIVPRKPERFNEVGQLITDAGLSYIRYSTIKNGSTTCSERTPVILGDTMGDLRKFYSLAKIIFVGRSLVPMGGSDMMEAAALGKCTIFGPHAFNFKHTVDALLADDAAILVRDQQELLQMMRKCLTEPAFAKKIAKNGQEVIRRNQGATESTVAQIAKLLNSRGINL